MLNGGGKSKSPWAFDRQYETALNKRKSYLENFTNEYTGVKSEVQSLEQLFEDLREKRLAVENEHERLASVLQTTESKCQDIIKAKNKLQSNLKEICDQRKLIEPTWKKQSSELISQINNLQKLKNQVIDETKREACAFDNAYIKLSKRIEDSQKSVLGLKEEISRYEKTLNEFRSQEELGNVSVQQETLKFKAFLKQLNSSPHDST